MFKISVILLTFILVAFPLAFSQRLLRKYNEAPKGIHLLLAAHTSFEWPKLNSLDGDGSATLEP
jgi:hypothetical protein